jgi:5-formyltetrahydrofolate cyclo-ligase
MRGAKARLRDWGRKARSSADPHAGEALAAHVLRDFPIASGAVVAGVWPLPGEMDLRPLLIALRGRGHPIVLPETPLLGMPLVFRRWVPGCAMISEKFGTMRPEGPELDPEVIFVPLLAFDRQGGRVGYGGGYYDRTLAKFAGRPACGFGFAAQEVDKVPREPHDIGLDVIATERGLVFIR